MPTRNVRVSVVVPFYNAGREMVEELHRSLGAASANLSGGVELIYVDDGSVDDTLETLRAIQQRDERVVVIELATNFGQHAAFSAGFDRTHGRYIVTMDADLQCDPEEIPQLIAPLEQGFDFVSGIRRGRQDPKSRQLWSRLLTRVVALITGARLHDVGCPFNACTADVVHSVSTFGELRRFLKPLAVRVAKRVTEVEVSHRPRHQHRPSSSYSTTGLVRLFMDFLVNSIGDVFAWVFVLASAGTGLSLLMFVVSLLPIDGLFVGPAFVWLIVAVYAGFVALLGLAGDYVQRIYRQSSGRPFYLVRHVYGSPAVEEHA